MFPIINGRRRHGQLYFAGGQAGAKKNEISNFDNSRVALELVRSRRLKLFFLLFGAFVWAGLLGYNLWRLQFREFTAWRDWGDKQQFGRIRLADSRAAILDRNYSPLAISLPAVSIFVRQKLIKDKEQVISALSRELSIPERDIENKLTASSTPFIWIKRQIPRAQAERLIAEAIPGIGGVVESRRVYPYGHAASHLVGFVGIDGKGLSGIEALRDAELLTNGKSRKVRKDALGKYIEVDLEGEPINHSRFQPAKNDLLLTIDAELQSMVDQELENARIRANAKRTMAVMVDPLTGEIIAMSQAPTLNLNQEGDADPAKLKNYSAELVFEPGSTFKPFVAAAALDAGLARSEDLIDCERGRFPFGKHTIRDVHPSGVISFFEVLVRSSNIGMSKIGMRLGEYKLHSYLKDFGFGQKALGVLPGESAGILRNLKNWAKVDLLTHSFGQGVAVTPLQMVRAYSALANKGILPELKIYKDGESNNFRRVISEKAAAQTLEMMRAVVEDSHGTGGKAKIAIDGVEISVMGKTGTAQKPRDDGRGYKAGSYVSSFVGIFDIDIGAEVKYYVLAVIVDEPNTDSIYGGTLAAPIFRRIVKQTVRYYNDYKLLEAKDHPKYKNA
ncbi:MAG TPA: penicillin-binding protein 2 [Oligoflexia bacterium]|nr:penicillin-binding protein 2 [Oligoflexia bacterium]HMP27758.1 penicillin-binding protein 2 [Oligoflexia bacterium]